ncbi:LacI family DNA-binding transcriptional regulator [Noviherbaspirillum sp.]|uniref:LacI family DNA-binding transcriptional regulator n=1 Tax=Noviherbaspirillum sp. TaxID=1926288 RepID=UPI002B490625|nr:LacI family DNA-binding transcriptional regulator [Noviherbaspirillum sp.]HJV82020.1 LacI family DNA-binding transcriptional regulator [Noviherbaspirillum sp.]
MPKSNSPQRGRSHQRVTLADVARAVGVSTMTASRAITRPELVTPELRAQIEKAIASLGYVPNRAARSLASARSHVIAVLIPSLSNAVFTDVLAGIQDAVDAEGYQVLIGNTRYSDAEEEKLVNIHLQSNPDGVILTGLTQSDKVRQMLAASRVPTVSMMDLSDDPDRYSVGLSQFDAGATITRHLLEKGYRRIGFIASQLDERTIKRAEGYRHALREAGLYDARREILVPDPSTIALGAELVGRLLAVAPDCDAVFCCNDDLAYGAIYQCQRRGIAIPRKLAICGFNDLPASAWMNPSVTTIATPRYRIGYESASLLKRLIEGERPEHRRIDLGYTLMAREST